ncbi:protein ILITYHIA [Aegilops tauschii subsp. strangulata]|uniref:TOG domain-containing protein n=22 Tax=Aegilops tauschii subsp. strangulata TaxID=200361 RepID=A0A453H8X7_AEGTS|nr:protein ILITYHIA [Aegilops tauschii subsp. strangulata]
MVAQDAAPEEALRAAAAEVSTPSATRRLRLFRDTLPPLLAKATESPSDTTLLVDLIFQTLPLYDDRASRKAVDDMVIQALSESTFMKTFAATLVQSMEKNLKVTSPLACFKLLRWSCYLLKWTQFATLSKGGFSRLANAQAVLSQVLMNGSFRQRRTCKQLFIRLFSESVGMYKMYIEEVKDLRIATKDSPAFINLILDFTVTSSSLFSEYKPVFLDLYVKTILSSKDRPSEAASEAFKPLFVDIGHEDFKNVILPSCIKMLKRNPEIVLKSIGHLLLTVRLDLSNYAMEFMPVILPQARHSDEERRNNALNIVGTLSDKSSDPDTLPSMFNAIKAILGGSEGKLSLPYQRIGMLNALEQLSRFPPKQISRLAPSVSSFLLTCYKGDGIEEVKLATLSTLGSWASVSSEAVQPDVVSFITAGLKEKDTLRKGHLKLIRVICRKSDSLTKVTSLLDHLIQLSKTGFSKATQRLDGIYALYAVSRLAAIDAKADGSIVKEKLWTLIAQSEPSLISVQLLSKLTDEDCLTCVDLLQSLLVDHLFRIQEYFSIQSLLQVLIYLVCHPSWAVRKIAYDATKNILSSSGALAEDLLFLFTSWLSLVGERVLILKQSDMDSFGDSQLPFIPSTEVLVKCLFLIAPYAIDHSQRSYARLILCSHHPCISSSGSPAGVWKRLQKRLKQQNISFTDLIFPNITVICKELLSKDGLFSSNKQEQRAALCSLATLMSISPNDTFVEFEKHFIELPDRTLHDGFSENDIKIFFTSEGQLSTEQGVYVAEAVASKNTKLAKGRFRAYDGQDAEPAKSDKRESSSIGKRETGKFTKKTAPVDKSKTAKEEARELQLKEEASTREKVGHVQENLALMLDALGELAIANPVFTHGQLPHLVNYIEPLLSSPIVSDAAFCAMLRLARCTAPPLCNWATEIAAAIHVMSVEDFEAVLDLMPVLIMEEDSKKRPPSGLFEKIVTGLTAACRMGPLPADSFTFVFPIMERILLSSKKTSLHDDVLQILSMHMDPILPLPRPRMLSVLYHVLSTIPAYHPSVGPMLNELCLGLKRDDLAQALIGVYAKEVHVRLACLTAIKCVPSHSVQRDLQVSTSLWIAVHDPEKAVAELAEELWDRFGFDVCADYSGIFDALSHKNHNVRAAAAEALTAALDENPDKIQDTLSTLFSLYIQDLGPGVEFGDTNWLGRQGIALALHSVADVLGSKDLPVVMTFLISRALADPNLDVRGRMINAGILIIDKHGKENVPLLFPIFESYLNKRASNEETYDLVREGVVIFTGALAKHLSKDDPKVHSVVEKLLDVLNTPSEAVQRAVSDCLSPLMVSKQEEAQSLVSRLLDRMMKCEKYGERRGAAFGLAGVVKGFRITSLKKYGIAATLQQGLEDRASAKSREGALLGFECLCEKLGRLFEPYVIKMLPLLLVSFSDQVLAVREAAECAARAMMSQLTGHGVKLVLPSLLKGLEDKAWRTKQSSVQLLGAMAYCAPQQLSQCLPKIVPKLTEVLTDTHPKVQAAGQTALQQVGSVIKNPEINALVPILLSALTDPNDHTKHSLDILLQTTFINSIDAPSLALLVPIVHRGLRERGVDTKKKAAQIVGNMSSLVTEPMDMIPYIGLLLPEVKKVLVDPIPEVRGVAARALGSLIVGMGEQIFPDLVPWLLETLKSDNSNVERSGAAQGLSEVLAALGKDYFDQILPDIIRNCSHQKASVRDGHLTLFRYLPRSMGAIFQNHLQAVLPAILDGLADENESVRDAALSAGHIFVEYYATTSLPLLLPAIEDGIFSDNWRIRQSSVELLGDLLFKVAGTSGKAILEGGSDDEGASTEAQGRAIVEVLGRAKRNEVLAAVYMVRSDVSLTVRQAAVHVWKTIVANTPRTLKEIMPVLMDTLISSLASSSSERRQVAGRALGELVRKLGERVLPSIIPILSQGLKDPNASRRQGVCIGLSEVMGSAGKHQLLSFMGELIPTIRTALCDSTQEVRESAGLAFSTLYKSAGLQAIDEIVPTLLRAMEDDETSATALDGLKQILSVRTAAILPHILPKLVQPPLSSFNAHALGALAEVAGPGLSSHIGTILPTLILAMDDEDVDVQSTAKKAAETIVLVIDDEGVETLIPELLRGVNDNQASMRRGAAYLIGFLFKNSKLYLADEAPDMMSTLITLLSDTDNATVLAAWEAFSRVVGSVPKEQLPTHIKLVRDAVSTARDKERRRRKGVPVLLPGLCLPKALQPFLPIFQQGLISGSAETKEQAAEGLGELIDVTSEKTLREVVVPITGPLIRILGDRFPWQVKSAILSTLTIIIAKGGLALKPFLPQLQTTFVKCLQDSNRSVRTRAASALGKLSALSTRIDPLVSDLLSMLQSGDDAVKESVLSALKGVVRHAGKSVSSAIRSRGCTLLKDLLQADADDVRSSAAKAIGTLSQYMDETETTDLVQTLLSMGTLPDWCTRHGALLTFSSISRHCPTKLCHSTSFPSIVDLLKDSLKDDKFPVREASTKTLGRLLCYQLQFGGSTLQLVQLLILASRDSSTEVRRRSLSCIKAAAKINHSALATHISILGPAIGDTLKDSSSPVRVAAERCAVHVFQLTKGADYVTTAQKHLTNMTGLEVRRLAKLPVESDDSESSDDERRT